MSLRTAMIFAAGRGERMRPLTEHTPKPLLAVGGKRLIEWHLEKLAATGIEKVVINTSHLASQFAPALGDGRRWSLRIHYIDEGPQPLETGGGMLNALPELADAPFLLVNGDIWCDLDFSILPADPPTLAHLVMVPNPAHRDEGDFVLGDDGLLASDGAPRLTYAGIGVFRGGLFDDWPSAVKGLAGSRETPPRFPLAPLLRVAMQQGRVSGSRHDGRWVDVGTPQRLQALDAELRAA